MFSTGYPLSSVPYSGLLSCSRGVCCALLGLSARSLVPYLEYQRSQRPTLNGTRFTLCPFLIVLPQLRPVHSQCFAPLCRMGFYWHCDCSQGFTLTHSTLARKLFF